MPSILTTQELKLGHKSRAILDAMVFKGLTPAQAAAETGITRATAYNALKNPAGRRYYENQLQVLRSGERARGVGVAISIRENEKNGSRARLEACRFIDGIDIHGRGPASGAGVYVNIGVSIQPGYIVDAAAEHRGRAAEILQQSGSVKNALEEQ